MSFLVISSQFPPDQPLVRFQDLKPLELFRFKNVLIPCVKMEGEFTYFSFSHVRMEHDAMPSSEVVRIDATFQWRDQT